MRASRIAVVIASSAFVCVTSGACGSRTGLLTDEFFAEETPDASKALDASLADASVRDADAEAIADAEITDASCSHDSQCDDHIVCTTDACDKTLHVCTHVANDSDCDDGIFCDGTETCVFSVGCVTLPRDCGDGITCTDDTCDEATASCVHTPDNSLCPISESCDPNLGCVALAYAIDRTTLYDVRLPSAAVTAIGDTGVTLTDLALHPSNILYGVSESSLYTVDQKTGLATFVAATVSGLNALDAAPDGTLYAAGGTALYTIDRTTGAGTVVMSFPASTTSSGDIVFVGARLLASAATNGDDQLVEFDTSAKTSKILGSLGFGCVYGLAAYGTDLYGFTCAGNVLSIDSTTGSSTVITNDGLVYYGATAR